MSFSSDLKEAKAYEALTVEHLSRIGYDAKLNTDVFVNGTHPHDLTVNGVKVEVKNDIMSAKTGNLCFELRALQNVDAKYLIHYVHRTGKIELFRIDELLEELPTMLGGFGLVRYVSNGGDAKKYGWKRDNPLYLVHISKLKNMKSRVSYDKSPVDKAWEDAFKSERARICL